MVRWREIARALALSLALLPDNSVWAQDLGVRLSQVLILDSERAYLSSRAGQQITKDLEAKLADLVAENRRIESELEDEELDLTEKRNAMEAVEFRVLANAFDEKVQKIRAEQDAKQLEIQRLRDADRQTFIESMSPIISRIAGERGALVILERRNVLLSADSVDITDEVIARVNASLGAATSPVDPDAPTPEDSDASSGTNE